MKHNKKIEGQLYAKIRNKFIPLAGVAVGPGLRPIKKTTFRAGYEKYLKLITPQKSEPNQRKEASFFARMDGFLLSQGITYMDEITPEIVHELFADLLKTMIPSSLNRRMTGVRNFFSYALQWQYIAENIFLKIPELPEINTPAKIWPEKSFKVFIKTCDGIWKKMLQFIWLTGCRPIEASNLKWTDIDWDNGFLDLTCGKNRKTGAAIQRKFPISPDLSKILHSMNPNSLYVFAIDRKPIDPNNLWQYSKHRLKKLGMSHLTISGMRRTFATALDNQKETTRTIQRFLGHSNIKTTARYIDSQNDLSLDALKKIKR